MGRTNSNRTNYKFKDSAKINNETYFDYLYRLKKIALSIFKWENLPSSMNEEFLERCLYYKGEAAFLKTTGKEGEFIAPDIYINTECTSNGYINLYHQPTKLHCYSFNFNSIRTVYNEISKEQKDNEGCIHVKNNFEKIPTAPTLELFAMRLYEVERTIDTNIKAQKTPVLILADEKQRLTMENLYNQYSGNQPFIFGDKNQLGKDTLQVLNTNAPFVADKLTAHKKEIWNEALTFLGINNIIEEKKERLITDEAGSNNEVINLNLKSYMLPRELACKQFNEKFALNVKLKLNSDLKNIIKDTLGEHDNTIKEGEDNG